jgi:hypothetical protein
MRRFDPLLRNQALPFEAVLHPVGFPLHLASNSRDVMEAATESWREWQPEFAVDPVEMRVLVEPEGDLAGQPRFRMQGDLVHVVSDAHNFAVADTRTLSAAIFVSQKTAQDHTWLRWFFVESMAYLLLSQRHLVAVHAACVARDGTGILLCGFSGAGKSTLAFACARAGFTYVADDCTWLLNGAADRTALGRPQQIRFRHDAARHFPELAGWIARARPNGKISIEVPTAAFPGIATAIRCPISRIVFLARDAEGPAALEPVPRSETLELLIRDIPSYGEEVNAIHERTVETLTGVPAFRLRYRSLEEAVRLLSDMP